MLGNTGLTKNLDIGDLTIVVTVACLHSNVESSYYLDRLYINIFYFHSALDLFISQDINICMYKVVMTKFLLFRTSQSRPQLVKEEEDREMCGEDETRQSQAEFQRCTHSITGKLNEAVAEVTEVEAVLTVLCSAVENIQSECVSLLATCVSVDTLTEMARGHMDQLMPYLVNIVGDKLEKPFTRQNCHNETNRGVENEPVVKSNELKEQETGPDYNNDEGGRVEEPQSRNLVTERDQLKELESGSAKHKDIIAVTSTENLVKAKETSMESQVSGSDASLKASFRAFMNSFAYSLITLYLF